MLSTNVNLHMLCNQYILAIETSTIDKGMKSNPVNEPFHVPWLPIYGILKFPKIPLHCIIIMLNTQDTPNYSIMDDLE